MRENQSSAKKLKKSNRSFNSKLGKFKRIKGTILDYSRWKNATLCLVAGESYYMEDNELRNAIKRALFFSQSFSVLYKRRKQQIDIMEECQELALKQCYNLMDQCKEVLKNKSGPSYLELANSLKIRPSPSPPTPFPFSSISPMLFPPPNVSHPPPSFYYHSTPPMVLRPPSSEPSSMMHEVRNFSTGMNYSCDGYGTRKRPRFRQDHGDMVTSRVKRRRFEVKKWEDSNRNREISPPGLIKMNRNRESY